MVVRGKISTHSHLDKVMNAGDRIRRILTKGG